MSSAGKFDHGLTALEANLARDLGWLNHPARQWVPSVKGADGREALDVLIIGAGMNGLCAAFALRRQGITRIRQIDAAEAGQEGPWLNYARMQYLRSPKHLTGPAQGLPHLTFRAWWEAQYGSEDWEQLGYIRREDWARYLAWYAKVTRAEIENATRLVSLHFHDGFIRAELSSGEACETLFARQVVFATGREGQAVPRIPHVFASFLGSGVQHSSEPLQVDELSGCEVVVIGLSASAFDNACVAAEAGAVVTLLGRASAIPTVNKMKQTVYAGFAQGFPDLPDAERAAWLRYIAACRTAPPRHTVQRAARAGVRIELGIETSEVTHDGDLMRLVTSRGQFKADRVILGTGFRFDLAAEPALAGIADHVMQWRDLSEEITVVEDEYLECPALGPGFEFRPKPGAKAELDGLRRLRCFTHAAQPSLGNLANDIPQASEGAERLARAIARDLFLEDAAIHRAALEAYSEPELIGDEYDVS